jgi:hypothetical protein
MSAGLAEERPKTVAYLLLSAIQIIGAFAFFWRALPSFRQLIFNPGVQLQYSPLDDDVFVGVLLLMQLAYWCRFRYVPIPFRGPSVLLSHIFQFLGRLSFVFGASLFSVVVFRHLPQLRLDIDISVTVRRAILFCFSLFALFCSTLELERLGNALAGEGQR